jgi:hypothetical protein
MEVIGAGFGRTGTMSLKVALEELGFGPCHHAIEVFDNPERAALWEAAARGERMDWDEVLAGYRSTVDWPACSFYDQLIDAYPEAKVILTVRDPERWYESVMDSIYAVHAGGGPADLPPMAQTPPEILPARRMIDRIVFLDTFSNRVEDRGHAIAVFNAHNEEVKRRIPPDRLLVYEVSEGWQPLCEFLGVEAPGDTPFPRLNDRAAFQALVRERTDEAEAGHPAASSFD